MLTIGEEVLAFDATRADLASLEPGNGYYPARVVDITNHNMFATVYFTDTKRTNKGHLIVYLKRP